MKRLTFIVHDLENYHLVKDIGQVPYVLGRNFGYDAEIVYSGRKRSFPYLENEVHGLKVTHASSGIYPYIFKNARDIDVMMLFHICTKTIYRGLLYKLLNPSGYLYVKADMTGERNTYPEWGTRHFITQAKRVFLYRMFIRAVDLVSFECEKAYRNVDNVPDRKKYHMPNGFDPDAIASHGLAPKSFDEKENVMLVVARHGDARKNSELVLDALELMGNIGNWRVLFIGPMTNEFKRRKNGFLARNPHYKNNIVFTGSIDDRSELFEHYNRAKILCLPSRSESWGLVCVEALAFGVVLVMSHHLTSAYDLTANGKIGMTAKNEDASDWARVLAHLMENPEMLRDMSAKSLDHFRRNFAWEKILAGLSRRISDDLRNRQAANG